MKVLVDTSIWSIALRRVAQKKLQVETVKALQDLIEENRAQLIGPIRQEILSGISNDLQFSKLREVLKAFPDIEILSSDYEKAAKYFNICKVNGIQGSHIDFLICSVANSHQMKIFTDDHDFKHYQKYLPIELF